MMRMLRSAIAIALSLALVLPLSARAGTIAGAWTMQPGRDGERVQLTIHPDGGVEHWDETVHIEKPWSGSEFRLRREAGTFHFTGTVINGTGSGQFTFSSNDAFASGLATRGLAVKDDRQLMTAAAVDLTLQYVDSIRADGYPQLGFDNLLAFRALGVTPASIADLRAVFGQMSAENVISTSALHVTRAYVEQMHQMGIASVTPERAVTFKSLNITRSYVDELAQMGFRNMSPDDIVSFKAMRIDGTYLRHLAAHGLKNLTAQQVIELKASGL